MLKAISFTFIGYLVYSVFILPLVGDYHYLNFKKTGEMINLRRAIAVDGGNTIYALTMAQLCEPVESREYVAKAYSNNNGDVTGWSLMFIKGKMAFVSGDVLGARECYKKAIAYNPHDKEPRKALEEVEKIIADNDRVLVKFR